MKKIKAIIANNCWAGCILHQSKAPFNSPTINLFIEGDDYIKFLRDFRKNIQKPIRFDDAASAASGHLVGYIEDIKIHFMHYASQDEVVSAWERRAKRLPASDDDILFKICDRDNFSEETFKNFLNLPFKNKIGFVKKGRFTLDRKDVFFEIASKEATCPLGNTLAKLTYNLITSRYEIEGATPLTGFEKLRHTASAHTRNILIHSHNFLKLSKP